MAQKVQKAVEDNIISMHDYCDTRCGKIHLIKNTLLLKGGPFAVISASIDRVPQA